MQEHRSFPSIITWVVFNEGWGQYDSVQTVQLAQSLDASRLVDPASGWVDSEVGACTLAAHLSGVPLVRCIKKAFFCWQRQLVGPSTAPTYMQILAPLSEHLAATTQEIPDAEVQGKVLCRWGT